MIINGYTSRLKEGNEYPPIKFLYIISYSENKYLSMTWMLNGYVSASRYKN